MFLCVQNGHVTGEVLIDAVRERYRRFARDEAPHRSALYARWAQRVADDPATAGVLACIPASHRQPPLVFAVARMLGSGPATAEEFSTWVAEHADALVAECAARNVQTNEPLRCAALLPALSRIDGPIALLEVGASAGLCLYPDRYSYRYRTEAGVVAIDPSDGPSSVVLEAAWRAAAPPRLRMPDIVWRAGLDVHVRDAADPSDRAWLTCLVWPGETGREARIRAALDVVAADPPLLVAGDATTSALAELMDRAPRDATLVVTTPGVLAHVPRAGRERIAETARRAAHWITMDAPGLHSAVDGEWGVGRHGTHNGRGAASGPRHPEPDAWPNSVFALAMDAEVIAAVDPLGAIIEPVSALREWHRATAPERG